MTIGAPPMTQATPKTACDHAQHDNNSTTTIYKNIYKSNITKTNIINIINLKFNLKKIKKT